MWAFLQADKDFQNNFKVCLWRFHVLMQQLQQWPLHCKQYKLTNGALWCCALCLIKGFLWPSMTFKCSTKYIGETYKDITHFLYHGNQSSAYTITQETSVLNTYMYKWSEKSIIQVFTFLCTMSLDIGTLYLTLSSQEENLRTLKVKALPFRDKLVGGEIENKTSHSFRSSDFKIVIRKLFFCDFNKVKQWFLCDHRKKTAAAMKNLQAQQANSVLCILSYDYLFLLISPHPPCRDWPQ